MISSAVVIPEQDSEQNPPSPNNLKRRQSSASSDQNKRPRLDGDALTRNGHENAREGSNQLIGTSPISSRRRSALGAGALEEKKRGQRLFGALLGTLSQTSKSQSHSRSSNAQNKKRDEIEQRQRERMRREQEEREEEGRRKREELDKVRRVEQKAWDQESVRIRHRNRRAMAGFLKTRTEPVLYYRPWELQGHEEDTIKRQVKEVEEEIQRELKETNDLGPDNVEKEETDDKIQEKTTSAESEERHSNETHDTLQHKNENDSSGESGAENDGMDVEDSGDQRVSPITHKKDRAEEEGSDTKRPHPESTDHKSSEDSKSKDDDHAGEELVEGQEDDVIY